MGSFTRREFFTGLFGTVAVLGMSGCDIASNGINAGYRAAVVFSNGKESSPTTSAEPVEQTNNTADSDNEIGQETRSDSAPEAAPKDDGLDAGGFDGVTYTIDSWQVMPRGKYLDGKALVLYMTATNQSDQEGYISWSGIGVAKAYQGGVQLDSAGVIDGLDYQTSSNVKGGVSLTGWLAFELRDESSAVEIDDYYSNESYNGDTRLTNPQTIDIA